MDFKRKGWEGGTATYCITYLDFYPMFLPFTFRGVSIGSYLSTKISNCLGALLKI